MTVWTVEGKKGIIWCQDLTLLYPHGQLVHLPIHPSMSYFYVLLLYSSTLLLSRCIFIDINHVYKLIFFPL